MGDKSQLLAMTFATKYKLRVVIPGVFLGILLNHGIAVLVGKYINKLVPMSYINIITAFVFILFGFLSLRYEDDEDEGEKDYKLPIITVMITFFLGEFGDKTQLVTMTLASESANPYMILVGTVSAMMVTSLLGIVIGSRLGKKIPENTIKIIASIIFIIFGISKLISLNLNYIVLWIIFVILIEVIFLYKFIKKSRENKITRYKKVAQELYNQRELLKKFTNDICDDISHKGDCPTCEGGNCLIGYAKELLSNSESLENIKSQDLGNLINKTYNKDIVFKALLSIIKSYENFGYWENSPKDIEKTKEIFEYILLGKIIYNANNLDDYLENIKNIDIELYNRLKKNYKIKFHY